MNYRIKQEIISKKGQTSDLVSDLSTHQSSVAQQKEMFGTT